MKKDKAVYESIGYVRASKEDGDKSESNTIVNQKALLEEYAKKHPDIHLTDIIADDGESGVSFDRPGFQKVMELVKAKKVNCIIVKDLSRLGRNWLEAGQYIQQVFPFLGVRFIAINDNYDSLDCNTDIEQVMIPFKNLMNEAYARDVSIKTRSVLATKRNAGEFIGPFVPYGYKRDDTDRHALVIDQYAAGVVRDIFSWRIDGMSPGKIAEKLNAMGILSPMEYKTASGVKFATSFKNKVKAKWNPVSVGRILKNEIYIGNLVQGKRSSANYKVKKVAYKDESDWTRIEDTHEPIISKSDFDIVNQLGRYDTRTAPEEKNVYLFAGVVFCGDCRQNMIRKTTYTKNKNYHYYVCGTHKSDKNICSMHSFSEGKLYKVILEALQSQINAVVEMSEILNGISLLPMQNIRINRLKDEIAAKTKELEKIEQRKKRLYDDYADGVINKDDFCMVNEVYTSELNKCRDIVEMHRKTLRTAETSSDESEWISAFTARQNIQELDRRLIVTLIDKIYIYEDERIEIVFKYKDKYLEALNFINSVNVREAI